MESTRPIRALMRGLEALAVLNLRNAATVAEVAQQLRLPRTTTYRMLETLHRAGYVRRDPADDRYRLTIMVHRLAHGFDDEEWVTEVARPRIAALGEELVWPVGLASVCGTQVIVRDTTDRRSPLAVERLACGTRLPLLQSAAGRAWLAFASPADRVATLEALRSDAGETEPLLRDPALLERMLTEMRRRGYADGILRRNGNDENTLAVPVLVGSQVLASVVVRFAERAVPMPAAVERFVPRLRATAEQIRTDYESQRSSPPWRQQPGA